MRTVGWTLAALASALIAAWWFSRNAERPSEELSPATEPPAAALASEMRTSDALLPDADAERSPAPPAEHAPTDAPKEGMLATPSSDLAARIDALIESYLTAFPDHAGLVALWQELADLAQIDAGSITESSGTVRGRFAVDLPGYDCTFMSQEPNGFSVHLVQHGGAHAADGLATRMLTIGCQAEGGRIVQRTAMVNHHLDPLEPDRVAFGPSGSRIVGWVMTFGEDANRAAPWYAKKVVGGKPASQRGDDRNFWLPARAAAPHEAWYTLLQPYLKP